MEEKLFKEDIWYDKNAEWEIDSIKDDLEDLVDYFGRFSQTKDCYKAMKDIVKDLQDIVDEFKWLKEVEKEKFIPEPYDTAY